MFSVKSVLCLCNILIVSSLMQNFKILIKSNINKHVNMDVDFVFYTRNFCIKFLLYPELQRFSYIFSSISFIMFSFCTWVFIPFWVDFCIWCKVGEKGYLFIVYGWPTFSAYFLHWIIFAVLLNISWPILWVYLQFIYYIPLLYVSTFHQYPSVFKITTL